MDNLNLQDVVLVGHSLGAAVAAAIVTAQPDRVRGIVLVDGGPELRPSAVEYMFRQFREQPWHFETEREFRSALTERQPLVSGAVLSDYAAEAIRARNGHGFELKCDPALKDLPRQTEPLAAWSQLQEVSRPILVLRGEISAVLTNDAATRFAGRLREGRFATVTMAGHAVMLDNPRGFHAAVSAFLSSAISRSTSTCRRPSS
jgi:pimeloyl-ACP methyl ester carboxylesterase